MSKDNGNGKVSEEVKAEIVKSKQGRKTKYTKELGEKLVKYVQAGNYVSIACQAVGICEATYYDWIKRGDKGEKPFLKFVKAIKEAQALAVARNVTMIQMATEKNWQAAAWWLERTQWKLYGRKDLIGGLDDKPIKHTIEIEDVYGKSEKDKSSKMVTEKS